MTWLHNTLRYAAPVAIVFMGTLILVAVMVLFPTQFGFYTDIQAISRLYVCEVDYAPREGETITLFNQAVAPDLLTCPAVPQGQARTGRRFTYAVLFISQNDGALYRLDLGAVSEFMYYPLGTVYRVTLARDSPIKMSKLMLYKESANGK